MLPFYICDKEMDDYLGTSLEGSHDDYEGNKDAARALLRVKQKLDGYEGGEMRSIHGQVIFFLLLSHDTLLSLAQCMSCS